MCRIIVTKVRAVCISISCLFQLSLLETVEFQDLFIAIIFLYSTFSTYFILDYILAQHIIAFFKSKVLLVIT